MRSRRARRESDGFVHSNEGVREPPAFPERVREAEMSTGRARPEINRILVRFGSPPEMTNATEYTFLEYCRRCGRKHHMTMQPCPTCGVYETPQPKSDNVANQCCANYQCDGCLAYREHLR